MLEHNGSSWCSHVCVVQNIHLLLIIYHKTIKAGYIRLDDYNSFKPFDSTPDLSNFANFYLEFEQDNFLPRLTWSIDRSLKSLETNSINVTCNDHCQTLLKKFKFKLAIDLIVGAYLDGGNEGEVIKNSQKWWCSSLIVDYIRVYELDHAENLINTVSNYNSTEEKASEICNQVSNELGRTLVSNENQDSNAWSLTFYLIFSFLVIALLFLLFSVYRMCKTIREIESVMVIDNNEYIELPDILCSMRENSIYSENNQGINEYEYIPYPDTVLFSDHDDFNFEK